MVSKPFDPVDPSEPPHWANSEDAGIAEIRDRAQWSEGQAVFADWASDHLRDGMLPASAPIDALSPFLGNLHKLEVLDGGDDFVYRIYGEKILRAANVDMQSRTVSELPEPTRTAFLVHYRDLIRTPRLFIGALRYEGDIVRHPYWHRAVAPIGRNGAVRGFYVLTYPYGEE